MDVTWDFQCFGGGWPLQPSIVLMEKVTITWNCAEKTRVGHMWNQLRNYISQF